MRVLCLIFTLKLTSCFCQVSGYQHAIYTNPFAVFSLRYPSVTVGYENRFAKKLAFDVQFNRFQSEIQISRFEMVKGNGVEFGFRKYFETNNSMPLILRAFIRYDAVNLHYVADSVFLKFYLNAETKSYRFEERCERMDFGLGIATQLFDDDVFFCEIQFNVAFRLDYKKILSAEYVDQGNQTISNLKIKFMDLTPGFEQYFCFPFRVRIGLKLAEFYGVKNKPHEEE